MLHDRRPDRRRSARSPWGLVSEVVEPGRAARPGAGARRDVIASRPPIAAETAKANLRAAVQPCRSTQAIALRARPADGHLRDRRMPPRAAPRSPRSAPASSTAAEPRTRTDPPTPTLTEDTMTTDWTGRVADALPADADRATLVGRVWARRGRTDVVVVRGERRRRPHARRSRRCARSPSRPIRPRPRHRRRTACSASLDDVVAQHAARRRATPRCRGCCRRSTCTSVKAAGVTFPVSMLERVIEERARGDADAARRDPRRRSLDAIGGDAAASCVPGSPEAARAQGATSSPKGCGASTSRSASAPTPRSSPRRRCSPRSAPASTSASAPTRSGTTPSPRSCSSSSSDGRDRRRDARQRRQPARHRGALARCCSARRRTTTPRRRSARSSGCSTRRSTSTTCAPRP